MINYDGLKPLKPHSSFLNGKVLRWLTPHLENRFPLLSIQDRTQWGIWACPLKDNSLVLLDRMNLSHLELILLFLLIGPSTDKMKTYSYSSHFSLKIIIV